MIDYVTLMLINMAAALILIGAFLLVGIAKNDTRSWSPPFLMSGLVATITGFAMSFTWPLPSPYNIAFGEMSVLLGVLLLGAGVAIAKGWDLFPLCLYAAVAGLAAILIGIRFIDLGLSKTPLLTGIGFVLTGLSGVGSGWAVKCKHRLDIRIAGAMVLFAAAAIWLYIGGSAYWGHLLVN
jgi:putative membrane protein